MLLIGSCLLFISCAKEDKGNVPEDPTKFTESSIIGIWVAVDSLGYVNYYYDIVSASNVKYCEASDSGSSWEYSLMEGLSINVNHSASYYKDGYLYTGKETEWEVAGDLGYYFDEKNQILHATGGSLWGFDVMFLSGLLGSDELFRVERIGIDEAYISDLTGWIKDAHVFRIKGERKAD